ncbi:hypothetical protein BDZ97DRAFT_1912634 [Flammula alnicola]|nr:hypothetical protein BDZ97DRAFT_1912634 [Flammula alnicola]
MNLFKRSKSAVVKHTTKQPDPAPTPSTSTTSSRPPLVPQTNIDLQASLSSMPLTTDLSSLDRGTLDEASRRLLARKISHRDADEFNKPKPSKSTASRSTDASTSTSLAPPTRTSPRSAKTTYTNHSDMYTQNDLHTFSFGAAPSTPSSSSSPIDPLSRPRDEADSDEVVLIPDTTPRPSVVGSQPHRIHPSQSSGLDDWPSPPRIKQPGRGARAGKKLREPDSDTASTHTFGTSSASASVSSLSQPRRLTSRGPSHISGRSSETPQTSANDQTSDEEMDGRHPFPPGTLESRPRGFGYTDQEPSLYLSEEEFEGYNEDSDHDGIEIDSVVNEASDRGTYFDYSNSSRESVRAEFPERRGSLAMNIPNSPSDRPYLDHHTRDNYSRRPSKSLEDLHSFSFAKASAPTSVPESEGDWRDLRKRSMQRDKELPPIFNPITSPVVSGSSSNANSITAVASTSSSNDLEFSWIQSYGAHGVVGFDPSEMTDIVGEGGHNGHRPSYYSFRKGSTSSAFRRQSTVSSTNMDIMHKNILGIWGNKKYTDQRHMWTFTKEKDRLPNEDTRRHNGGVDRERPSISTLFTSRPSTSAGTELSLTGSISFFDKSDSKEKATAKEKSAAKEKTSKEPWKGMALGSEEIWANGASGRFKVSRKNAAANEAGKPPQQRLNITYIRSPYAFNGTTYDHADGPAVTIHKHSKAGAFSIARHYRTKSTSGPQDTSLSLRNPSSSGQVSSKDEPGEGGKKKSNMILLAPRRVQKAYTSTNTTRKLESHGLLDESGRTSPRDADRMKRAQERERRARAKEKEKEKTKDKGKEPDKDKDKDKKGKRKLGESSSKKPSGSKIESKSRDIPVAEQVLPDSSEGSTGSVANASGDSGTSGTLINSTTAVTTPDPSDGTSSMGSVGSVEPQRSVISHETTSSDRTISRNDLARSHPRRQGVYDIDDDDDSADERPRYPTRTPHRETYATLPPEVFESAAQELPSHGLFGWGKSRGGDRGGHRVNAYLEASYNPPWPVTQPRSNSETRKFIVNDLNTSFQDVGLLPATNEIKGSTHDSQHKRKREREQHQMKHAKRSVDKTQTHILEQVPPDALYMLLPLWPGETDPSSAQKNPYTPVPIPTHARQYLLICYRTPPSAITPQEEGSKTKSGEKKRSRDSPSSSSDDGHTVLLSTFHISARVVSYPELQGSGVRIPDLGLAVSGPLEEAYMSIPGTYHRVDDYVIGVCHSRETGIEFVPEGFEKMGLSRSIPNPSPVEPTEDDDSQSVDTISILTPIGRAVMEMAWVGGMAVTSYNPNL